MERQEASVAADTQFAFTSDGPWSDRWEPGMEFMRALLRFGETQFVRWSEPIKLEFKGESDDSLQT